MGPMYCRKLSFESKLNFRQKKSKHLIVYTHTICSFEVRFLAALASWLCRLHSFWLFLADKLEFE